MCIKHAGLADILVMETTVTFSPSIATAYHVDPGYLAIHGYGLDYEYVIQLNDINSHIVATKDGQLAASQVPLPFTVPRDAKSSLTNKWSGILTRT